MSIFFVLPALSDHVPTASTQSVVNRTCYWYGFRAGSIRDTLYIYGGDRLDLPWTKGQPLQLSNPGYVGGSNTAWSTNVYTLNLSIGFDVSQDPPDLGALLQPKSLGSHQDFPGSIDGAILGSSIEFYMFGGMGFVEKMEDSLVNYQVHPEPGQTIFNEGPKTDYQSTARSDVSNAIALGSAASVPSDGQRQAFYFSGMHTANSTLLSQSDVPSLVPVRSLIVADLSAQGAATWENLTLPSEVPARARSQLIWVPKGRKGLLVAIGGVPYPIDVAVTKSLSTAQLSKNEAIGDAVMKTISIFDIEHRAWYQQNTTGDVPRSLEGFCAVLARRDGTSTMEIFIYGGMHARPEPTSDSPASDAVYALSLPSFTWVKVNDGNADHGRTGHACTRPLPNQMITVGGWRGVPSCIKDDSTLDIFNLNTLKWTRMYKPSSYEDYVTPSKITNMVQNNAGELRVNDSLKKLFSTPYPGNIPSYWPQVQQPPQNRPIGAIIGGSIAGGLFLVIAIVLLWFCRPAKRQARRQRDSVASAPGTAPILRWLKGMQQPGAQTKSALSDATTEVDSVPPTSTKPPAELDSQARTTSVATVPQAELEEGSLNTTLRPFMAYSTSPPLRCRSRSPISRHSESIEAAGAPLHEVHGDSKPLPRPPPRTEITASQSPTYMTAHHMHPWNIGWHSSAPRERHDLGSIDQGPLHPSVAARKQDTPPDAPLGQTSSSPSLVEHATVGSTQPLSPLPTSSIQATPTNLLLQRIGSAGATPQLTSEHSGVGHPVQSPLPGTDKSDSVVSPIIPQQDSLARNGEWNTSSTTLLKHEQWRFWH